MVLGRVLPSASACLVGACAGTLTYVGACASAPEVQPIAPSNRPPPLAEIAELELRAYGVDRFATCPPPGELGEPWFPEPPPWTAPAPTDAGSADEPIDEDFITRTKDRTLTEIAIDATQRDFRSCYRRGLLRNPGESGRVAIVLRIGADGRVARVDEYAACELAAESITCMKDVAARLRFPPPEGGSGTVVIPAVFTSRDASRRTSGTSNDSYTARAYVALEAARPGLHACEEQARRDLRPPHANATFILSLDANGNVASTHVDPWSGEQSLLECAASALSKVTFPRPPNGTGTAVARLNFNPRQGGR